MTKIYEVEIESNKYTGQMTKRVQVVAGSCSQAVSRCKGDVAYHEEITSVRLVAKADK